MSKQSSDCQLGSFQVSLLDSFVTPYRDPADANHAKVKGWEEYGESISRCETLSGSGFRRVPLAEGVSLPGC